MLELLRSINDYVTSNGVRLNYWQRFYPDYCHLYDKKQENLVYVMLDDDWTVYGGFIPQMDPEVVSLARYINNKIYQPMLISVLRGVGLAVIATTTYVRLRIATNRISKLKSLSKEQKDKWIAHVTDTYWARKTILADFYVDHYLPF